MQRYSVNNLDFSTSNNLTKNKSNQGFDKLMKYENNISELSYRDIRAKFEDK